MKTNYPVHPLADIFPMMPDDEIAALAEDIKANGLAYSIMLDAEGKVLVDGRNRLKACELAGVEPRFDKLNGQDPTAYIFSVNIARRNMTKGQRAMAVVMIYPETTPGKKTKGSSTTLSEANKVSTARLSQARVVLRHSRKLAEAVLAGITPLDAALAEVQAEQQRLGSDEAKLDRLRQVAPDLADLVTDERMKLSEAAAALDQRIADETAKEANKRETLLRLTEAALRGISAWASEDFAADVKARTNDQDFCRKLLENLHADVRGDDIKRGAKNLTDVLQPLMKGKHP